MDIYVGLDIGGTKFMVAAADTGLKILKRTRENTPCEKDKGIALLNRMIRQVSGGERIIGMGAAIGGPLDWQSGIVSPLHQKMWRKVPLKEIMEREWQCPFHVDVDTNVAALGEYHMDDRKRARLLYITLSTGMGAGFLIDGRVYRGMKTDHPEIAHQSINYKCSYPENISCECESETNDCLEALVSGRGILQIYKKNPEELNDAEWAEVAYNLGQGLRNLATIYLPDEIVLGGGIVTGERGQKLLDEACTVMKKSLKLVPAPDVRSSRLGYDTALVGALVVARYGL